MGLGRVVALFHEVGGCGLVHCRPSLFFFRHAREGGHPVVAGVEVKPRRRGVLDRPVKPDDDS
jgi:hypothetical protein